jgi:hypothetical protein
MPEWEQELLKPSGPGEAPAAAAPTA